MKLLSPEQLTDLQGRPDNIRNLCILAHVDHGKTTFADVLISGNGIISSRLAGTLRYMDSRQDEQERGITMKTSAISLVYAYKQQKYLINLMDSPGHVDFAGEVSTATRLCDGALVVCDVVEGLCPQTVAVLRQAWKEDIRPLLVLNKIDRLILELKLTPLQVYRRLQAVLEQVNAVAGELFLSKAMKQHEDSTNTTAEDRNSSISSPAAPSDEDTIDELELLENEHVYFSPENGNVLFASAIDGWGFRLSEFAGIYARKVPGLKEIVLQQTLWGDYYLDSKLKRIRKGAASKGKKPLFVQLVLGNIMAVYDAVMIKKDKQTIENIVRSLSVEISARDIRQSLSDPRGYLKTIMSQWLPLSSAGLLAICTQLPSPKQMSESRVKQFLSGTSGLNFSMLPAETQKLKDVFLNCDSSPEAPVTAFISKVFPYEADLLPNRRMLLVNEATAEQQPNSIAVYDKGGSSQQYEFMAFARVFSGTIRRGSELYILPPKYDCTKATDASYTAAVKTFVVNDMYLMMGRELELIETVPAGNVLAIGGLGDTIMKTGTISSTLFCPAFTNLMYVEPIVRVAIEPANSADMPMLVHGLKLLEMADSCVKCYIQSTGEHVLVTAGEVHLQRCLDDLRERFANLELVVSEPIIPFMETIVPVSTNTTQDSSDNTTTNQATAGFQYGKSITIKTANKLHSFSIRAVPLPNQIISLLERHEAALKIIERCLRRESYENPQIDENAEESEASFKLLLAANAELISAFRNDLASTFEYLKSIPEYNGTVWTSGLIGQEQLWAIGPGKARHNILFNAIAEYSDRPNIFDLCDNEVYSSVKSRLWDFDQSVINGFRLRCGQGPLCDEPMRGVAFIIEQWDHQSLSSSDDCPAKDAYGPLSGQIIATVKEGCKRAFQRQPQRLELAMYNCSIQATADVLGKVYSVIARRGGRVVNEEMTEGSSAFQVSATLPVVESFGFADEIRKKTSGLASPQLVFSHWEVLDVDPFWVPTTNEELEQYGDKADFENRARLYMNSVRKRKGQATDEKVVEVAEKQRTLTKMK